MLEWLWNFIIGFQFNSTIAIGLYWIPVGICLIGYLFNCMEEYKADFMQHTKQYYTPTLTVGRILGRFAASFLPVINIFLSIGHFFGIITKSLSWVWNFIQYLGKKLNIPLVPARPTPVVSKGTTETV